MKKRILLMAAVLFGTLANAQVTPGSVTMGAGYANQVYYKMSTQATNAYANSSWDIALLRTSAFGFGTRINDTKGISVYEASPTLTNWATLDVTNQTGWVQLYNNEKSWSEGTLEQGSATYGWGEYNPDHHVRGTVIFVLKYADGSYKKLKIDDFFSGYTMTYASWNGTAWGADVTVTIPNSTNPTNRFNYYSFEAGAQVVAEPAIADWDFMFTKYKTDYFGDGSFMQDVTGAFHNATVTVAENLESTGHANLNYSTEINTIGYDWKTFNMSNFTYTINTDKAFYIKYANGTIYRLIFSSFIGSSTGVITFNHEDVTNLLGTVNLENNVSFGVYPNPSTDKKINVVYDLPAGNADTNTITVFNLTGAKVFESKIANTSGFFNQEIDLGALNTGVYVLQFQSGNYSTTKKIVLN